MSLLTIIPSFKFTSISIVIIHPMQTLSLASLAYYLERLLSLPMYTERYSKDLSSQPSSWLI